MSLEATIEAVVERAVGNALREKFGERAEVDSSDTATGRVLTTPEAAEYLRVDRHALGRLVKGGQLRCKQIGSKRVFREEWLIEFLERSEPGVTSTLPPATRLMLAAHNKSAPSRPPRVSKETESSPRGALRGS